jgi:hypothetical protein
LSPRHTRGYNVSFDVVLLFTRVPIRETMSLLSRHFEEDILRLFRHVLFRWSFYEQTDSGAMSLPLSPVIASFFKQDFGLMKLDRVACKPLCWFHCVDNSVIWPHGPERLRLSDYVTSEQQNIQFTMETERDGHIPFLDIELYRRPDGSLGHKVYSKHTHSSLYLNSSSHHHPSNKPGIISTLVHRARALCDQDSLHVESVFLGNVFRQNSYTDRHIRRALNPLPRVAQPEVKPDSVAFLPYVGSIFKRISKVLSRHIMSVGLPPRKILSSFLQGPPGTEDAGNIQHPL